MSVANQIKEENIFLNLKSGSKREFLSDVAQHASSVCGIDALTIFDTVMERENLGSTGFGGGTAIPHGRFVELNEPDISVRADVPIYPMLDTDRISAITGKISKPTIGILYDPNVPGFNSDIINVVAESLDEKHRLIVTRPDCLYKDSKIPEILDKKYKCEIIQRPYVIGFDWSIESLCSIVISDYSLNPGTYGYMCATAMAMGKLLICDKHGDYVNYSTDRVSAIHFDDYNVIPKYITWAETHKDKADKLRAAAMYQIYNQDKDPNLHKLRGIIGCL